MLWNRRNAVLNQVAFNTLDLSPGDRVLEIGFGGGYLLDRILPIVKEGFVAGVDFSESMVSTCERYFYSEIKAGKLDLRCSPAETLPYPAAQFTKACSVNSIFYWLNLPKAFSEIQRVLVEDGQLVLCFTCRESLEEKEFTQHGIRTFDVEQVEELLAEAGFGHFRRTIHQDKHRNFWCLIALR